jgi:hypothetical protein
MTIAKIIAIGLILLIGGALLYVVYDKVILSVFAPKQKS